MSLAVDMHNVVMNSQTANSFGFHLLKLIRGADSHNRDLLRKVFPNAVAVYDNYVETGKIIELEYD